MSDYDFMSLAIEQAKLAADELEASENPITFPPSSSIAASKLRRVRVEGSKNNVASFLYLHFSLYFSGFFIISFAVSIREFISSTDKSIISIKLLIETYLSIILLHRLQQGNS